MSESHEESVNEDEQDDEDVPQKPCYGHEPGHKYSGELMEQDEITSKDQEEGNFVCPIDYILDHRYQVKTLIGRGTFCLVWLAFDHVARENVAIKVLKRSQDEVFEDEYILNRYLSESMPQDAGVIRFHRMFYHLDHPCLVFELAAHNLLTFLNYFDTAFVGIPLRLIKKIVRDTLMGLDYMHKRGVIHTDLKPENVMASRPLFPHEPYAGDDAKVFNCLEDDPNTVDFRLGDIGNSCFVGHPMNELIQTRQYRSPEVLLGLPYDTSADIWSLACMTFELATRDYLFNPMINENDTETSDNRAGFDAIHLSMIEQVCGRVPEDWAREGLQYDYLFNDGELIEKWTEEMPCLYDQLIKKDVPDVEAGELADFLEPMLAIIPAQRPSAEDLLQSPWLHQM